MIINGRITEVRPEGTTFWSDRTADILHAHAGEQVQIFLQDDRRISPEQRRKAWVLIGEITAWAGYRNRERKQINASLKYDFLTKHMDELTAQAIRTFSLSDCDMTTASLYIGFLIDFVIEHQVQTKEPITELADDIAQAVYSSLKNKRCIICGAKADLHHVDAVGMGNDRTKIDHIGRRALPLCRIHHQEAHSKGNEAFMELYHIQPVKIDEEIAKKYNLNRKKEEA